MSRGYPADWHARRRQVYERDEWTCQNCGRQGGPFGNVELHAHHVVPKSRGGSHRPTNLVTLCADCHDAVHHKYAVAPTAGRADAGSGAATRLAASLRRAWRLYKRLRRVF